MLLTHAIMAHWETVNRDSPTASDTTPLYLHLQTDEVAKFEKRAAELPNCTPNQVETEQPVWAWCLVAHNPRQTLKEIPEGIIFQN